MLASCDPRKGIYMAAGFMYRGDVSPKDVNLGMANLKASKLFKQVDWGCVGIRLGINK